VLDNPIDLDQRRSALGHLQTFLGGQTMSALPLKADVGRADGDVGYGPKPELEIV